MLAGPDDAVDLAAGRPAHRLRGVSRAGRGRATSPASRTWAASWRARLGDVGARGGRRRAINRLLFEEQGFRGNTEDYYDPRNSFLNDVLDRRTGIPITLSMVYMEVARRAGVAIDGVGLPGHFIVEAVACSGPTSSWTRSTAARSSRWRTASSASTGSTRDGSASRPRCSSRAAARRSWRRMLRNLKAIYAKAEDYSRALACRGPAAASWTPATPEDLRDRGLLYAALDCYALAARDLEDIRRSGRPASPEAAALRERIDGAAPEGGAAPLTTSKEIR